MEHDGDEIDGNNNSIIGGGSKNDNINRLEDEDRTALEGLSSVPVPTTRKVHSYSQQLHSPSSHCKRHPQVRKYSLDDVPRPPTSPSPAADFFPFSTPSNSSTPPHLHSDAHTFIDTALPTFSPTHLHPLPEFLANGGAAPIFKTPVRAAVHPGRPTCLELRPHPLRETQVGKFLRNIACTDTQLWAGQESGVRFWNFHNIYDPGSGLGGRVRRGDEDAAPFHESVNTSPTMCLLIDSANRLVWTGHKDGKVRSWRMDDDLVQDGPLKEGLSWQAHKGPILSMVMSPYGELSPSSNRFALPLTVCAPVVIVLDVPFLPHCC